MPRKISLKLNVDSIGKAISEVQDFRKEAMDAMNRLCEELVREGKSIAQVRASTKIYSTESTGNLVSSIEGFFDETTGKGFISVFADNGEGFNYAQVFEFGSGVVMANGEAPLPPYKDEDWDYDRHGYRNKGGGWWYAEGKWTRGQAPRPFMWETYQELLEKAQGKAKSVKYYNNPSRYGSKPTESDDLLSDIGFID